MKIHIVIPDDKHEELLNLKKITGHSLNWIVTRAITNYLKITSGNKLQSRRNKE